MKKFEFRLGSVLRIYELRLDLEKAKLSQALAQEQEILNCILRRAEEVRRQNEAIREFIELRSGDLRALSAYNLSAQTQSIVLHEDLARVRRLIRLQRENVIREERKVKLVSKLKEKKLSEWARKVNQHFETDAQEIWLAVHANSTVDKSNSDRVGSPAALTQSPTAQPRPPIEIGVKRFKA
ncbi:MAG TPA: hypothetical protein VFA65_01805 [Bryobacteraceae bacterium]|nr:hypothetical protein [Bryobacteraceae bacterium]